LALSERNLLVVGASLTVLGTALSVTVAEDVGAGFMIVGATLGVWGLHRFGRSGADPARAQHPDAPRDDAAG
jgi:hypothetical protein